MNGWRELGSPRGNGRRDPLPIELPVRAEEERRRRLDPVARLVAPEAPDNSLSKLALRSLLGSIGLALAVGVAVGRLTAVTEPGLPAAGGSTELRIRGAGHLGRAAGVAMLGSGGLLADAELIRERLLATGVLNEVSVERLLPGGLLVRADEKQAVALLDREPLQALAGDGTVLGPATAADLEWAGAADLVLVAGVPRSGRRSGVHAALAGRLAEALRTRPELDRLVSELDVSGGPLRIRVVLRPEPRTLLLTDKNFLEGLERVATLLPDLTRRWPGLTRVDARVPDRLLVRADAPEGPHREDRPVRRAAPPEGGQL